MSRVPQQPDQPNLSPAFLLHKEGFSIRDYRLISRIGEGSFGQVWKAERGGFEVALKILKASVNSEETQRELKSLETLKRLHHRYLLHTENFWSDGDQLYIEMELADGGTLKDRFKQCQAEGKVGIPAPELLKYFTEAAKALDYLHSHRPVFLHRDIKPANVLLVKGCAKLGDFGLLRQVTNNEATHTQGGTIPYMAPESIKEDKFSIATDLFSFAVMYAELRQGSLPFTGNNQFQMCERIMKEDPKLTDIFDPGERKVLLKALSKAPEDRYASCGEFVFELNRVVPWLPAVDVPTYTPSGASGADTGPTHTTDARAPKQTDSGATARRGVPITMHEMDVLKDASQSPGAPTVTQGDGTVPSSRLTPSSKSFKQGTADSGSKMSASRSTRSPKVETFDFLEPARGPDELGWLGVYRVVKVLGRGGMGVVFLAEDTRLGRPVALKVMHEEIATDETSCHRFTREAQATAKIRSDHVIAIYEIGNANGLPYIVTELLQGKPLDAWLAQTKKPSVAKILDISLQIASGLDASHRAGVIHRDIKPANIWVEEPSGRIKILDFGLARTSKPDIDLTVNGEVMGTPAYMAPEQAKGKPVDHRCDLFSLGCVLYLLAAGVRAFDGPNSGAVMLAIAMEEPVPIAKHRPDLPPAFCNLVMQLLAKDPQKRPASASAVVEVLKAADLAPMQTQTPGSKLDARIQKETPPPPPGPRPKPKRSKILPAVLLLAILGGVLTGVGFVVNRVTDKAVRRDADEGQFLEAVQRIHDNRWMFLGTQADDLSLYVEGKWWERMKPPVPGESPTRLLTLKRELKDFMDAFPRHEDAKARHAQIEEQIAKINPIKPPPPIDEKRQAVLVGLKTAKASYDKNEFEKALTMLKSLEVRIEHKDDRDRSNELKKMANDAIITRGTEHDRLTSEFKKLNTGSQQALARKKLEELVKFEATFPNPNYPPLASIVEPSAPDSSAFLTEAWRPLIAQKVTANDAHNALNQVKKHRSQYAKDVAFQKHLNAFEAFVLAYDANTPEWDKAVEAFVTILRDPALPSSLCVEFWPALVKLEANRAMFRLEDLVKVDSTLPTQPAQKQAQVNDMALVSLVLERLVKSSPSPWYPKQTELKPLTTMAAKVAKPSDRLATLHAECLLRQNAPWEEISRITFANTDWYTGFVAAWTKEKRAEVFKTDENRIEAAKLLADKLSGNTADVKPIERAGKAVEIVRGAVKKLEHDGVEFVDVREAKNAVDWMTKVVEPLTRQDQDPKAVDDRIELAYAALKALDKKALALAIDGLGIHNRQEPTTLKGYTLITQAALKLAQAFRTLKKTADAIDASKLCQKVAFEFHTSKPSIATELNSKAVDIHASIEYAKNKKKEDYYPVYVNSIRKTPVTAFNLPLMYKKLDFAPALAERKKAINDDEPEFKNAFESAAKISKNETDTELQEWWNKLRYDTMVKLADVRLFVLNERVPLEKLDIEVRKDRAIMHTEYRKAIHWFEQAKSLEKYSGKRLGELSGLIGFIYWKAIPKAPEDEAEKADALRDAKAGQLEFRAALKAFAALPANQQMMQDVVNLMSYWREKDSELTGYIKYLEKK